MEGEVYPHVGQHLHPIIKPELAQVTIEVHKLNLY